MNVDFYYMSGAGNLFTVIDNSLYGFRDRELSELAVKFCSRKNNSYIDTEGFLAIDKDDEYDFSVAFYNPDGSSSMMCGNGARCSVRFAEIRKYLAGKKSVDFRMLNKVYLAELFGEKISVKFQPPVIIRKNISVDIDNSKISGDFIDVDSAHFVIHSGQDSLIDFDSFGIDTKAEQLRHNKSLGSAGANINILRMREDGHFDIKTFERGVERVTGACGTGTMSTAVSLKMAGFEADEYIFHTPGKSILTVKFDMKDNEISRIILTGEAVILYHNTLEL